MVILFILGRQPEISLAELNAVFGSPANLLANHVASLDITAEEAMSQANRLGSIVKIAESVSRIGDLAEATVKSAVKQIFTGVEGKITLGISAYGKNTNKGLAAEIARNAESALQPTNSVRLVPVTEAELSSATVGHNKLAHGNPKKVELNFVRPMTGEIIISKTCFVQDIAAYTFRDRSRPKRDAHNGMLPPKLAQTTINLARGASETDKTADTKPILLDPFCGTGVVLQEAALMGLRVVGTDLSDRMIDFTRENLDWLAATHHLDVESKLLPADATEFNWHNLLRPNTIKFVATETYLGRPYVNAPSLSELKSNIANCDVVIRKFLTNIAGQLDSGTGLCVAVPCWFVAGKRHHLPCSYHIDQLGYRNMVNLPLIYHREEQIVGRELLVLQKR